MTILLIEDEEGLRTMMRVYLESHGIQVHEATNGKEALDLLDAEDVEIHVIILDLMMPEMDGYSFLQRYQEMMDIPPVLILSALDDVEDKLKGFSLGVDDYLTKPFDLRELTARITAISRRSKQGKTSDAEVKIVPTMHQVWLKDQLIPCTPKEFEIVEVLASRPDRVFSRDELVTLLWGHEFEGDERVVDTHVKNIREKCRQTGAKPDALIATVWGVGYRFGG